MKTCEYGVYNPYTEEVEPCGNIVEGSTEMCASHNAFFRKLKKQNEKSISKRAQKIEKQKAKNSIPQKTISKNPKDWSNTFLCSDGTKVRQIDINEKLSAAYKKKYPDGKLYVCEGCGLVYAGSHAHIIPQARCKAIGKAELIWHPDNFFRADFDCNRAMENPEGNEWKQLKNIYHCLAFMNHHDPELFSKFESRLATEPHKI